MIYDNYKIVITYNVGHPTALEATSYSRLAKLLNATEIRDIHYNGNGEHLIKFENGVDYIFKNPFHGYVKDERKIIGINSCLKGGNMNAMVENEKKTFITRTVITEEKPAKIVLELSIPEAVQLYYIYSHSCGLGFYGVNQSNVCNVYEKLYEFFSSYDLPKRDNILFQEFEADAIKEIANNYIIENTKIHKTEGEKG